jgi:hypothetical protein
MTLVFAVGGSAGMCGPAVRGGDVVEGRDGSGHETGWELLGEEGDDVWFVLWELDEAEERPCAWEQRGDRSGRWCEDGTS